MQTAAEALETLGFSDWVKCSFGGNRPTAKGFNSCLNCAVDCAGYTWEKVRRCPLSMVAANM